MHMILLHIQSADSPSIHFTQATDFLFDKHRNLSGQDALAVFGTPDKVIAQLIHDVFGVLLVIHTNLLTPLSVD